MMGRMQKRAAEARVYLVSGGEGGYQLGCVCLGEAARHHHCGLDRRTSANGPVAGMRQTALPPEAFSTSATTSACDVSSSSVA